MFGLLFPAIEIPLRVGGGALAMTLVPLSSFGYSHI
jgi:hypothetical protein